MSFLRHAIVRAGPSLCQIKGTDAPLPVFTFSSLSSRSYASKSTAKSNQSKRSKSKSNEDGISTDPLRKRDREKATISTSSLIPGSQLVKASKEYTDTQTKMEAAAHWFRKECATLETRATGRVTPSMLESVRVALKGGEKVKLEEIASIGVREGTTLVVTVFEEAILKHVEMGIYDAKLPNISPQRQDSRTIKIPIPKPTVDARTALYTSAHRQAEDVRVQIRRLHQDSLKKSKFVKHSKEIEELQKLTDKFTGEVDNILAQMKKNINVQ